MYLWFVISGLVWLAGRRQSFNDISSSFIWSTFPGSTIPMCYSNWEITYPKAVGGWDCVAMNATTGLWINTPCSSPNVYTLCELPWVQENSSICLKVRQKNVRWCRNLLVVNIGECGWEASKHWLIIRLVPYLILYMKRGLWNRKYDTRCELREFFLTLTENYVDSVFRVRPCENIIINVQEDK
jgi:hypothetical protein